MLFAVNELASWVVAFFRLAAQAIDPDDVRCGANSAQRQIWHHDGDPEARL